MPSVTKKLSSVIATTITTTPDPGSMTFSKRTRRTTSFKNTGSCKHSPKKHDKHKEEEDHDEYSDEDNSD